MAQVIDFGTRVREREFSKVAEDLSRKYGRAEEILSEYLLIAVSDPNKAMNELSRFLKKVRDLNSPNVTGGPNPEWTGPLLDVVGMLYPMLNKNTRKESLVTCLDFLDSQNFYNSQEQVSYINEPWLVSDIIINRSIYWCGYGEYADLISKHSEWEDLLNNIREIRSEFFFALALMQPEYSSLNIRANYYKKFPELKDRTEDAIATFIADIAQLGFREDNIPIEETIGIELLRYDSALHDNIRSKIKEEKWVKL